jgi:signal transduction histidine kinase
MYSVQKALASLPPQLGHWKTDAEIDQGTPGSGPKRFRDSLVLRYIVSIVCVVLATAVRAAVDGPLKDHHAYTFYFAAIAFTSWYSGFWPSILAIVLSYVSADWFFIPPRHAFDFHEFGLDDFIALGGFLMSGLAIAFTSRALHRAKDRSERRQAELGSEILARKEVQQQLEHAQELLKTHAVTLEQRVEERTADLKQTIHSLEGVCYHIAHDLRAPLRAMQGFTALLVTDYGTHLDPAGEDYARRVADAARHMDKLIESLLLYGRLAHLQFSPKVLDLEAHIENVLDHFSSEIHSRHAEIRIERPLPAILGGATLLDHALLNLIGNALKFVPPEIPPRIAIRAETRGNTVRLWIRDNGIGIPKEYQSKIFQIFERLQSDHHTGPGTGIGLAVVSKAVQRMGGRAGVESQLGHGSDFWIELPLASSVQCQSRPTASNRKDASSVAEGSAN